MDKITDRFVLFVYKNPDEDVLSLLNRFVYSLTPEEREMLEEAVPLVLETGKAARDACNEVNDLILADIRERAGV